MNESTQLDPNGVEHEIDFWRRFVQSERFLKGWVADIPTPELNHDVRRLLVMRDRMSLVATHVLDVGSGPVSILNGLPGHIRITTCDPLSSLYQEIFDFERYAIAPPHPYAAEDVYTHYCEPDEKCFDVVHISNALDHCVSPLLALQSLAKCVCRDRGWLIVQGFVCEATYENHAGFHQFDLSLTGESLLIGDNLGKAYPVHPEDLGFQCVWAQQERLAALEREWFVWILQARR